MRKKLADAGEGDLYLIDEVDEMEMFCTALTVAQKDRGLLAQVKARAGIRLATVTDDNRDRLHEELERWLRDRLPMTVDPLALRRTIVAITA